MYHSVGIYICFLAPPWIATRKQELGRLAKVNSRVHTTNMVRTVHRIESPALVVVLVNFSVRSLSSAFPKSLIKAVPSEETMIFAWQVACSDVNVGGGMSYREPTAFKSP